MEKIIDYYNKVRADNLKIVASITSKIHLAGTIRLFLVILLFTLLWLFKDRSWQLLLSIFALVALFFTILMILHNNLSYKKDFSEALSRLCQHELDAINGNYSAFEGKTNIPYHEHPFAEDLDLFGDHSLLQSINRTVTPLGHQTLVNWLLKPLTNKQEILKRQKSFEELSRMSQFRQNFYVKGKLQSKFASPASFELKIGRDYELSKSTFWKIMQLVIPGIWILILIGSSQLPSSIAGFYFVFCIFLSNYKAKQISELHSIMGKADQDLSTYSLLIQDIEKQNLKTENLLSLQNNLKNDNSSQEIKKLSNLIGALNQRFSLMGIVLNILLLRDIRIACKIEKWIQKNIEHHKLWIESLGEFDAYLSLATYVFNHPHYVYPEITDEYFKMEGEELGHPLMLPGTCITNNIRITKAPGFMIITGANMAGKSTYLRTIGINFILGCIGAPVYAKKLRLYPATLVTSLRTNDSLNKNESYFFAELKRLKMIIDRLKNGEKLFIILDEILKGTNSIDKQKGSIALMKQLVNYKSCGIIATHDLVLGNLIDEFPKEVENYRFEASITNNELKFSYKMLEGIAQNMNACFLMKKMGITV